MRKWYTQERVCEVLRRCEQSGINTWQFHYSERSMLDLQAYRAVGGSLQWILLGDGPMLANLDLIPQAARLNPIGILHHGGATDQRFRAGEMDKVREFLKRVRASGVMAGLSAHNPAVIEFVESRGWDIDFYMTSFYQVTRTREELLKQLDAVPLGEVFLEEDPARMCKVVRQTRKTCLGFKILAAGRRSDTREMVDRAFQFAFDHIKPQDCVIVGMYPRHRDEVRENTERVTRLLGTKSVVS